MTALLEAVGRAAAGVWWYLREVSGETAYDRYVEHCGRHDAAERVLSRREFERRRQDDRDRSPQQRCC
ncbi:CstA-like transporter-associated (seleno)protein [Jiangella anatolica]|uniref:DUF466 domain-containing protein n=1 Tax=Jiangella anatolica TaxID=2670374 RepID=A0A2W2CHG0_9ACTN|nr:YbdD/YjiX family protein [Jiangella anatolica]PZF84996.1 hypothetical protein C1I92_06785 [Jiangella anatolica]